jgi:uncharacterized membrane protein
MTTLEATAVPNVDDPAPVRRIGAEDVAWALSAGWQDFREKRGDLVFIGLIYPVICLVAVLVTFNEPLLPLLFPLVAGLSIAGPAVASGFYELARRKEEGLEASWWHFLDPLKGRSRVPLAMLTLGLAVLFVGWLVVAYAIYTVTLGAGGPLPVSDVPARLFTTREGWALIVLGNLAGLGFAIATLVFSVVSFPMVIDKPVDASAAVRTSIAAFRRNPAVLLGWGVRVAALLLLGLIPFAIGLAVVLPWLGYATWHLYTRLVER